MTYPTPTQTDETYELIVSLRWRNDLGESKKKTKDGQEGYFPAPIIEIFNTGPFLLLFARSFLLSTRKVIYVLGVGTGKREDSLRFDVAV